MRKRATILAAIAALASTSAMADFTPLPWTYGDPFSTYQQWETFSSTTGPNAPNSPNIVPGAPFNTNGIASVSDSSGASFVTGGGNIYSPTARALIDITVPQHNLGGGYNTTVVLQFRTQGSEADYANLRLNYNDGSDHTLAPAAIGELFRQTLGGFGGSLVDTAALFQIPFSPGSFVLEIDAASSSMSFDRALVDTLVTRNAAGSPLPSGMNPQIGFVPVNVPEPTFAGIALSGLLMVRRRRTH